MKNEETGVRWQILARKRKQIQKQPNTRLKYRPRLTKWASDLLKWLVGWMNSGAEKPRFIRLYPLLSQRDYWSTRLPNPCFQSLRSPREELVSSWGCGHCFSEGAVIAHHGVGEGEEVTKKVPPNFLLGFKPDLSWRLSIIILEFQFQSIHFGVGTNIKPQQEKTHCSSHVNDFWWPKGRWELRCMQFDHMISGTLKLT